MWQLDWNKLAEVLTYNAKQPMIFSSGLFLFLIFGLSLIYVLLAEEGHGAYFVCFSIFLLFLL